MQAFPQCLRLGQWIVLQCADDALDAGHERLEEKGLLGLSCVV